MTFGRVLLAAFISVVAVLVVTVCYVLVTARGAGGERGSVGIDVVLLPHMTIYSPLYWLVLAVVLAVLWWFLWRWLFAG